MLSSSNHSCLLHSWVPTHTSSASIKETLLVSLRSHTHTHTHSLLTCGVCELLLSDRQHMLTGNQAGWRSASGIISLSLSHTHTQRHTLHNLSHTHTLSLSLSLSHTHTHTHTHTLSLSLSLTHTHRERHTRDTNSHYLGGRRSNPSW